MLAYQYADADHLAGSCTTGAKALHRWLLDHIDGTVNSGCINRDQIPGSQSWSIHAEGRAIDLGGTLVQSVGDDVQAMVERLVAHSDALGVQCVIFRKHIWSTAVDPRPLPYSAWRFLTSWPTVGSHNDHAHIELTREAAESLTYEQVDAVLNPPAPVTEVHDVEVRIIAPVFGDPTERDEHGVPKCPMAWARFVGLWDGKVVQSMWWLNDEQTRVDYDALGYFAPERVLYLPPAAFRNVALTSVVPTGDDEFVRQTGRPWLSSDFRHVAI